MSTPKITLPAINIVWLSLGLFFPVKVQHSVARQRFETRLLGHQMSQQLCNLEQDFSKQTRKLSPQERKQS